MLPLADDARARKEPLSMRTLVRLISRLAAVAVGLLAAAGVYAERHHVSGQP
jgi:hypothetical protein